MNVHVVFSLTATLVGVFCVAISTLCHLAVPLVVWSIRKRVRCELVEAPTWIHSARWTEEWKTVSGIQTLPFWWLVSPFIAEARVFPL